MSPASTLPHLAAVDGSFWSKLFDTSDYPPRWSCGEWTAAEGWLHVVSDILIWGAYTCIPFALLYFVRRRRDAPLKLVFALFAAFILSCGTTHLLEAVLFWHPIYRVAGLVKAITAVVSIVTVFVLLRALPIAVELRGPGELEQVVARRTEELEESRQEAETARQRAEALSRSRASFLAGLHSESRTPLDAILAHATRMSAEHVSDADRRRSAQAILWHGKHQGRVLSDALHAAASQRPRPAIRPAPFDVRKLVDQSVDMVARASGLDDDAVGAVASIRVHVPDDVPSRCTADALRVRQVLVNLLETALANVPSPPSVGVDVTFRAQGDQRGWLCFRVHAAGLSVSGEALSVVFDPGRDGGAEALQDGGSGWADLILARRIVEVLGGELRVENGDGNPTRLLAEVPVRAGDAGDERAPEAVLGDASRLEPVPIRVLMVALPSPFTEHTVEHVQRIGGQLRQVSTPSAAIAAVKSAARPFHAVIVDLDLPDLDVASLRDALERAGLRGRLLGITFFASEHPEHLNALSGPPLVKPLPAEILFDALAGALDRDVPESAELSEALLRHADDKRVRRAAVGDEEEE